MDERVATEKSGISSLLGLAGWGNRKTAWRGLGLLGTTLLIFFVLFSRIDVGEVSGLLAGVPMRTWLGATLLTLSFPLLSAIRWRAIMLTLGYELPIKRAALIIVGIWPLSAVSPAKSGDLLKAYSLRHDMDPVPVAGSVLTERGLDLLMLAIFALIGGIYFQDGRIILVAGLIIAALLGGSVFIRLNISLPVGRRFQDKFSDLFRSLRVLGKDPRLLIVILLATAANWFASIGQTHLLFQGVDATVPLGFTIAALPVAIIVGLLPISIAGMGTRDTAFIVLFSAYTDAPQAVAVALLYSFFGYWLLAIGGLPLMRRALGLGTSS